MSTLLKSRKPTASRSTAVIKPIRLTKPLRSLPIKERRKVIAQDVLARFGIGQLKPKTGVYVKVKKGADETNDDLQTQLASPKTECTTCAIGGAICSVAGFEDRITLVGRQVSYYVGYQEAGYVGLQLDSLLGKVFLNRIENAFEGFQFQEREAGIFYRMFRNTTKRFVAIWTQVAEHGDFTYSLIPGFKEAAAKEGFEV